MSDLIILSDAQRRVVESYSARAGISPETVLDKALALLVAEEVPEELLVPLRNAGGWRE